MNALANYATITKASSGRRDQTVRQGRSPLETKSIYRLLSLLELGGQTSLVRVSALDLRLLPAPSAVGESNTSEAHPPTDPPWFAELVIQEGALHSCAIYNTRGERLLVGEQALAYLERIGQLFYEFLPLPTRWPAADGWQAPAPAPPPSPPPVTKNPRVGALPAANGVWRPARTAWGETVARASAQSLTRDQRRVLGLVDGQRSAQDLARLLGWPVPALQEVLQLLQQQQLIS